MRNHDTIVARATPDGCGGVGILRISGSKTKNIAEAILGKIPTPRYANYTLFKDKDGSSLDQGIALWFPAPNSLTGEDVLELHCHGGPIILNLLLKRILTFPETRIANPGEFSERAFLNDKIDLTQAEAVADLINASSELEARCALNSFKGVFSSRVNSLVEEFTRLRIYVEATIDFPNEATDFLVRSKINTQFEKVITFFNLIFSEAKQSSSLCEGIKIVITGRPNAGKSSLFNALVGREAAIVTNIAGTTRDILNEKIQINGTLLHIIDTAGLRNTSDVIENIAIANAWKEIKHANLILLVVDSSITTESDLFGICSELITRFPKKIPVAIVRNKIDITGETVGINQENNHAVIRLSTHTGEGMNILKMYLKKSIGYNHSDINSGFLVRHRHLKALETANKHLNRGRKYLLDDKTSELLAEELRLAQLSLNEITGKFTSDDLLGKIFSSFCIGK